ncbi:MAG: hypothetical protein AAF990_17215 [Bacteroidota bacterium]
MKSLKNYLLAIGLLFCWNQLSAQVDIMPPEQANYKNQLKVGIMTFLSEDKGLGVNFQYFRDFHKSWAYSVAFQMRYGSGNNLSDFQDEDYPFENQLSSDFGGIINYGLNPESSFSTTVSGLFHFRKQKNATVFKAGTGLSIGYFDEVSIAVLASEYYISNFNPRSIDDLREVEILTQEYNRFLDLGWILELGYQYYLNNRIFVGLSSNIQTFFKSGAVALGCSLDFGVNF